MGKHLFILKIKRSNKDNGKVTKLVNQYYLTKNLTQQIVYARLSTSQYSFLFYLTQ